MPSIAFANIQYPLADLIIMALAGPSEEVVAFKILLQYCVKTYKTTVVSGTATTVVVNIETAKSLGIKPVPSAIQCPPEIEAYGLCWDTPNEFNLTLPISTSSSTVNYSCPFETVFALQSFLASTLSAAANTFENQTGTSLSAEVFSIPLSSAENNYTAKIVSIMENLATSITNE